MKDLADRIASVETSLGAITVRATTAADATTAGINTILGRLNALEAAPMNAITPADWETLRASLTTTQGLDQNLVRDLAGNGVSIRSTITAMQGSIDQLKSANTTVGMGLSPNTKPIMESRVWESVVKLTNDKLMYRDWRMKLKSSLKQVTKIKSHRELSAFLEDQAYLKQSANLDREALLKDWANKIIAEGRPGNYQDGDWAILEEELEAVLMAKCED